MNDIIIGENMHIDGTTERVIEVDTMLAHSISLLSNSDLFIELYTSFQICVYDFGSTYGIDTIHAVP